MYNLEILWQLCAYKTQNENKNKTMQKTKKSTNNYQKTEMNQGDLEG